MNAVLRGSAALAGGVALAVVQYYLHQPWRYLLTSAELIVVLVAVVIVWEKTKQLSRASQEHQVRLDAIANFASRAQVVYDANKIVDSITASLYVHEMREAIESGE